MLGVRYWHKKVFLFLSLCLVLGPLQMFMMEHSKLNILYEWQNVDKQRNSNFALEMNYGNQIHAISVMMVKK
jgi:hypothetical protein